MELDDLPKPQPQLAVGQALDSISVGELQQRIEAFEAEIVRLKAEITRKQASKQAADAFFKG